MEAETVDRALSPAEVDALNRDLARRLAARAPSDARAAPKPAEKPAAAPRASSSPAPDWSWLPADSAAHQYKDPTLKMIVAMLEPLQEAHNDAIEAIGALQAENAGLRTALAELRAEHAETKGKLGEASHKLDRLTITHKGDPGERGPVGADGREGRPGAQGPRGNRGQKGFTVAAWEIDVEGYRAIPQFDDGSAGPAICLLGLFQQFQHDTEASDVDLATEQAALQRAALELQVERTKRGLPAR